MEISIESKRRESCESLASLLLLDEGNTGTTNINQEKRILVLDDDLFNLVNLQNMLTTNNFIEMPI